MTTKFLQCLEAHKIKPYQLWRAMGNKWGDKTFLKTYNWMKGKFGTSPEFVEKLRPIFKEKTGEDLDQYLEISKMKII